LLNRILYGEYLTEYKKTKWHLTLCSVMYNAISEWICVFSKWKWRAMRYAKSQRTYFENMRTPKWSINFTPFVIR